MLKYLWILRCQSYLLQYIDPTVLSMSIGLGHDKKIKQQSMPSKRVQIDLFHLHTGGEHYYAILLLFWHHTPDCGNVINLLNDIKDRRMEWGEVFIYPQRIGDTLIQGLKSFLSLPQTRLKNKTLFNHSSSSQALNVIIRAAVSKSVSGWAGCCLI